MSLSISPFCPVLLLIYLGGCTSTVHTSAPAKTSRLPAPVDKAAPDSDRISNGSAAFITGGQASADLERLARLWRRRTREGFIQDYPLGPGDVLEISVPGIEELSNRTVRVSSKGTISLPLVGVVQASELAENGLRDEIRRRLEETYMYDPQVNLFVREYRSRQVAVTGAVAKPGLYSLASRADTLLDMISRAGGMTDEAAARIHFIPAKPVENEKARNTDPILIDLKSLIKGRKETYLALPARPGDVIMVPGSGEVSVEGWVGKPGSYRITPGLTVLGAVAAAGGSLYAADTSSVKIVRTNQQGETTFFLANLEDIKRGEKPDIRVQESDVIVISSSSSKLVAYGIYRLFSTMVNIGANVPIR